MSACRPCRRRAWLLGRLAGNLDRVRDRLDEMLCLEDGELIDVVAGSEAETLRAAYDAFDPEPERLACATGGPAAICRHDPAYPRMLHDLRAPPAVLHLAGSAERLGLVTGPPALAIVGARRASPYTLDVARALAREAANAGLIVVSGLARGIDAAAHSGALDAGAPTVAVLASRPQRPYPPRQVRLHCRIVATGLAVSELGPEVPTRRWMFLARNRIIAALAHMTVVVGAGARSGSLVTARHAARLDRALGAVPGPVTAPLSAGPHGLLRQGARLIGGIQDVLDALPGEVRARLPSGDAGSGAPHRVALDPPLARLLHAVASGEDLPRAFALARMDAGDGMAALAELELAGYVRRQAGGRFMAAI
jgi:DNA processing protein